MGASNHIFSYLKLIGLPIKLPNQNFIIGVGNCDHILAKVVREIKLQFRNNIYLVLNTIYFITTRYFIYISNLYKQFYKVLFNNHNETIYKIGTRLCTTFLKNNLYLLNVKSNLLLKPKKKKLSSNVDIYFYI